MTARPEPAPPWRRRIGARQAAVVYAGAVTLAVVPPLLLAPGEPVSRAASFGGQLLLIPPAGLLWWRWRRAGERVLAHLMTWLCAAWSVSVLSMVLPGPKGLLGAVVQVASPATNVLALLVLAWLCRGRGRRLGLVRLAQGTGVLVLLGACCWVLLLGSGQVITDLPAAGRATALGYLANYLVSLCLGWYALFRHRRVGIPGLGLVVLGQALGGGVTVLAAVRSLAGDYVLGSPIEVGWVAAAACALAAAAARRAPSARWQRNRQRMALVGVLLLAAGSMALGVARFVEDATADLQARYAESERLRDAVDHVYKLTVLEPVADVEAKDPVAGAVRRYQLRVQAHASAARVRLREAAHLAGSQGAGKAQLDRLAGLVVQLDAYAGRLAAAPEGPRKAAVIEQGQRLRDGIWAAARDSDRRHNQGLAGLRRVTDLLQLAVPLGLVVAGLTFVSSWTTLARRERLLEDAEASRRLTKAVVGAQERERGRIAADLHDGPLQQVAAWRIKVEMVLRKLDRDPPKARELLASLDREVAQQAVELRRLMHALRPPVLDELGLEAAVGMLARDLSARADVEVALDIRLNGLRCTPEVETLAYRIVQEGLTNIAKHAAASKAVVSLEGAGGGLVVRVADNGRGMREFEPDQLVKDGHFGLAGIDERVEIVGGRLELVTAGGEGTVLEARLPASIETQDERHEE